MLRVTPIYGSSSEKDRGATCTLVEYGGVKVLWNVGMTNDGLPELPEHKALLVGDSSLASLGNLPKYTKNYPSIPTYCTFPTVKMGQMALYDHHAAQCLDGRQPAFTLDQVDAACSALNTIKYSQTIILHDEDGKATLSITPHRAGHLVGASYFLLESLRDETLVVLVGDYHVAKELHLESSTILKYGTTPDVLVCFPGGPVFGSLQKVFGGLKPLLPTPVATQAEKTLTESILSVLRREGHVLLPTDASGRVLELLLLLDTHWDRDRFGGAYNLCWWAPLANNTLDFAKSQLEWMSLGSKFDSSRKNPFQLNHVQLCSSARELEELMGNGNPTCLIASGLTLEHGPARDMLLQWADNPDNAVIFTDSIGCHQRSYIPVDHPEIDQTTLVGSAIPEGKASTLTAAGQLLQQWCLSKIEGREMDDVVEVDMLVPHRAALSGQELKEFLAQEERALQRRNAEEEQRAMLEQVELAKGQLRLGEEEKKLSTTKLAPTIAARPKKKSRFDSSLFLKFSKPQHLTFELREEAVGIGQSDSTAKYGIGEAVGRSGEILEDEYGIAVIPERFTDIVTGVDPSKFSQGSGRIGEEVMRRGLGFGADGKPVSTTSTGGRSLPLVNSSMMGGATISTTADIIDEQVLEAEDLSEGKGIVRGRNGRLPTKVTTLSRCIEVLAEINYIPLEGKVSGRAARQSVRALQPRQVVVLGGACKDGVDNQCGIDEVTILIEAIRTHSSEVVQAPIDGETIELNVGHAAYSVRLVDTPYQRPEDIMEDSEPPKPKELFEAQLGECTVSRFDFVATGKKVALDGSIVLAPRMDETALKNRPSIYVSNGDVLLTDLRSEIIAQGMKASYSAHVGYSQLVVNGKIVVKKDQETGALDIEGPLCEDFYSVRSIVCGQYVTL